MITLRIKLLNDNSVTMITIQNKLTLTMVKVKYNFQKIDNFTPIKTLRAMITF
jgi:hypothetical protein